VRSCPISQELGFKPFEAVVATPLQCRRRASRFVYDRLKLLNHRYSSALNHASRRIASGLVSEFVGYGKAAFDEGGDRDEPLPNDRRSAYLRKSKRGSAA
jgi:hypothetical protein